MPPPLLRRHCHLKSLFYAIHDRTTGFVRLYGVLVDAREQMTLERTAKANALTALLRTMDLAVDVRQPLSDTRIVTTAAQALVDARHGRLIPVSMLLGALLVSVADILGRTLISPAQIPAGLMIALIGGP